MPVAYRSPREGGLRGRTPGPESVTAEEIAAWVAEDQVEREKASDVVKRSMAFIARFKPKSSASL